MLTGKQLRDAYISGANNIINNKTKVDELNVFPVPDGDTGTNMSMTISAAKTELSLLPDTATVETVSQIATNSMLRGARGNSGVILSLLFRGFSKGLKGKETADVADLVEAMRKGVDGAYKAVQSPSEGTILTVARVACEAIENTTPQNVCQLFEMLIDAGQKALDYTPEQLPVLKKAGVVDAGGQGYMHILRGMYSVIKDGTIIELNEAKQPNDYNEKGVYSKEFDTNIGKEYSADFLLTKNENASREKLRAYFEMIGTDVVVVEEGNIIKCHVQTDEPGKALTEAIKHGYMTDIKIVNNIKSVADTIKKGLSLEKEAKDAESDSPFKYAAVDNDMPYGIVAVGAGEGIISTFNDLGANAVVTGGQTMNPSTENILKAIQSVPAKTVFVLPNNKNIIMAAEQTIALADREVIVLHTRTVPQGITAMLSFDPDADKNANAEAMEAAAKAVSTGSITFAARDSDFDGHKIKAGDILALDNSKLSFTSDNIEDAAAKLVKQMQKRTTSFITLYYGEGITEEQAQKAVERIQKHAPKNAEVSCIYGGQPVYYYLIAIE